MAQAIPPRLLSGCPTFLCTASGLLGVQMFELFEQMMLAMHEFRSKRKAAASGLFSPDVHSRGSASQLLNVQQAAASCTARWQSIAAGSGWLPFVQVARMQA